MDEQAKRQIGITITFGKQTKTMDSNTASSLLVVALLCILSSSSTAFNITRILANYPDFSTFNNLLTQTGLAQQINTRQTITVLAVSNSGMGAVSGKPIDVVKRILGAHVILDYYDQPKLQKIQKKSSILTTLYQTTGMADTQQGFLNVTKTPNGIIFGSAVKGSQVTASLEGSVAAQPYNISVLQVSSIIEAPGIENMAPPPPPAPKKAPAPAPTKSAKTPAPVAEEPTADDSPTEAPTPAADAPDADAPGSSPPEPNTPPADDSPAAAPAASSALHNVVSSGVALAMGLAACMIVF
ncbi:fasciclin-like arabinogalactan protein 3 [Mercurialis annua]|uniref:fasciclin-like arabinogalactan protein 3 n=1 Tax=Mercurialis annua TaxID=3986 RepID=UPI00215F9533|nr:fasciclin-like arabinogalactan protein 3 [Mercurialis annua]